MLIDTIEINKSLIPYEFNIALGDEVFTFKVDYNNAGEFFTIGLSKGGKTLTEGTPIVYGRKLFEDIQNPNFPAIDIIPYDLSKSYNKVTYDNLCEGVLLIIDNGEIPLIGR